MRTGWLLPLLVACGATDAGDADDQDWLDGKGDGASAVDVAATHLDVDISANTAVATIELEKNGNVELEIGDLTIDSVVDDRGNRRFKAEAGKLRRFRALLYQIEKDGPAGKRWGHGGDVLAAALGYASYVAMVDPVKGQGLRERVLALRARYGA